MGETRARILASGVDRTQVFTPPDLADFMVRQLAIAAGETIDVLEPGAGAGALAEAVLAASPSAPRLTMVERDPTLGSHLTEFLEFHRADIAHGSEVVIDDFLVVAPEFVRSGRRFSHIIMNPPFGRVERNGSAKGVLEQANVRASNYFAAFLWLASDLLAEGGKLVAVVPRSVLSGARYAATREHIFGRAELVALHHFTDRRAVFERDSIQQEVVVMTLRREGGAPTIRYSQSATVADIAEAIEVPRARLQRESADHAVLVPTVKNGKIDETEESEPLLPTDVSVSVGSVVDFRVRADLVRRGDAGVPLIGSELFFVRKSDLRSLKLNERTQKFVYPPGRYVVVRRISPSEARPRVQAKKVVAEGSEYVHGVAFENHLLVVHADGSGLTEATCNVVLERLSDARTEAQFCERGGTTQVNVSDIKALRYGGGFDDDDGHAGIAEHIGSAANASDDHLVVESSQI